MTAARSQFAKLGYQATTIEAIATDAEVSVPTVYATFKSKQGILAALVAGAVSDPEIRKLAVRAEQETDPTRRLRKAAHIMRLALESESELTDILWQAGSGNSELQTARRQMHANRHRRLSEVLAPMLPRTRSRRFVDTVWALSSPEVYRLLVRERGFTPRQFEDWLANSLISIFGGSS
ncbi:MAG TPA: helix-turn-helix domain-containing protein [Candidatus Dormibacteraeota bacterium]|jgi:AcrR family transcriptional regulator|nr:helix-turn-helix domain-containing protein [Candidatus Dormibacteraeota bacterium]